VLLRGSGQHTGIEYDLQSIRGAAEDRIPHAPELLAYADAFHADEADALAAARDVLHESIGDAALVDAAGIVGIFDAVVRIADATGAPLEDYKAEISEDLRADLGINDFPAAREA
jgi:alkylhydroperoxidase family enzyme